MKQWLEGHPKARLMARKRAAILDAAHREFMAHGFAGTTMEAIAAAAKVSIMTLYRHADDKEDLFRTVIAETCERALEAEPADSRPATLIRRAIEPAVDVRVRCIFSCGLMTKAPTSEASPYQLLELENR